MQHATSFGKALPLLAATALGSAITAPAAEQAPPGPESRSPAAEQPVKERQADFLLNVGPDKKGRFEEASVRVLAEVGSLWKSQQAPP